MFATMFPAAVPSRSDGSINPSPAVGNLPNTRTCMQVLPQNSRKPLRVVRTDATTTVVHAPEKRAVGSGSVANNNVDVEINVGGARKRLHRGWKPYPILRKTLSRNLLPAVRSPSPARSRQESVSAIPKAGGSSSPIARTLVLTDQKRQNHHIPLSPTTARAASPPAEASRSTRTSRCSTPRAPSRHDRSLLLRIQEERPEDTPISSRQATPSRTPPNPGRASPFLTAPVGNRDNKNQWWDNQAGEDSQRIRRHSRDQRAQVRDTHLRPRRRRLRKTPRDSTSPREQRTLSGQSENPLADTRKVDKLKVTQTFGGNKLCLRLRVFRGHQFLEAHIPAAGSRASLKMSMTDPDEEYRLDTRTVTDGTTPSFKSTASTNSAISRPRLVRKDAPIPNGAALQDGIRILHQQLAGRQIRTPQDAQEPRRLVGKLRL